MENIALEKILPDSDPSCSLIQSAHQETKGKLKRRCKFLKWSHLVGLFFCFSAGTVHAITSILAKKLKYIPAPQLSIHTTAGIIFYSISIMMYNRVAPVYKTKVTLLVCARSFVIGAGYSMGFLALNYIPVADYSVIAGSTPVLTTILAKVFIKEPCGIVHTMCLILNAVGIVLVTKVPMAVANRQMEYDISYLWGILLGLTGSLGFAISNVIVRIPEVTRTHYSVMVFYVGVITTSLNSVIAISYTGFDVPVCGVDKWIMFIHTIAGNSVVTIVTIALQYEEASVVTLILNTVNIVLSFLWQILVDGIVPDIYSSLGAVAMTFCIALICFRVWIANTLTKQCRPYFASWLQT